MTRTAAAESTSSESPLLLLSPELLRPSPLNPRKHFDQGKLEELAATMAPPVGVIEPLVARIVGSHYEIIAGERRWRASRIAGLVTVPVVVRDLTDAQVLEIMVIENDQREGLNPVERGEGYRRLLKSGFDIDVLAERIGRSRRYIYDHVTLETNLCPEAKRLLLANKFTGTHAIELARLSAPEQMKCLDPSTGGMFQFEGGSELAEHGVDQKELDAREKRDPYLSHKAKSVRELQQWIVDHVRFAPGTPVNRELFPETADAVAEAKKVIHITHDHYVQPDAKNEQRVYGPRAWKQADGRDKSKPCERSVLGVVVVGAGRGEAFQVCVHKECDVHWGAEKREREREAKKRVEGGQDSWAIRQQKEREKYDRERQERERAEKEWREATPALLKAATERVKALSAGKLVPRLLDVFEKRYVAMATRALGSPKGVEAAARVLVLADIASSTARSWQRATGIKVLRSFGVNVDAILKSVQPPAAAAAPPKTASTKSAKKKAAKKR